MQFIKYFPYQILNKHIKIFENYCIIDDII